MPAVVYRGATDVQLEQVAAALAAYERDHPRARIDVYRQNSVSMRVRVIDPDFAGVNVFDRNDAVWAYFAGLPEDVQQDISFLLLLTPAEVTTSLRNRDFENPIPSDL